MTLLNLRPSSALAAMGVSDSHSRSEIHDLEALPAQDSDFRLEEDQVVRFGRQEEALAHPEPLRASLTGAKTGTGRCLLICLFVDLVDHGLQYTEDAIHL